MNELIAKIKDLSEALLVSCFLSPVYIAPGADSSCWFFLFTARPARFPSLVPDGLSRLHAFVALLSFQATLTP